MTRRDDITRLHHMLDYARVCRQLMDGRQRSDLDGDIEFRLALTRAVEIIGEAAAKVSQSIQQNHPSIPWREIIGTRHHLIHGYDTVDLNMLWRIVTEDLPPLIAQLEAIIDTDSNDQPNANHRGSG